MIIDCSYVQFPTKRQYDYVVIGVGSAGILLAKRMGKKRIIAETGAGQHGVATATVCARFGLKCIVKFGEHTNGLLGEKFQCEVKQGDKIKKGSLLFSVNSAWLKQQGVANICIMSVLNAQALKGLLPTQQKYVDGIQDSLFTLFL